MNKASLRKVSLWSSVTGLVLPGCWVVLDLAYLEGHGGKEQLAYEIFGYAISGFLFVTLELVAFGCGIAARRTATGRVGWSSQQVFCFWCFFSSCMLGYAFHY